LVGEAVTVKQNGECPTDFVHPLLEGGECSERNEENAGIEFGEFFLAVAQLRGMFTTGYSAKVTEEDQQGVSAFEDFAKRDLLSFGGGEGEVGGGGVEFQVSGSRFQIASCTRILVYLFIYRFLFAQTTR